MIEDINAYLVADTATHDVVGDRIYWADAPQKPTMPYMTYFVVDDPHDEFTFDKLNAGQPVMRFNVYDDNAYLALSIGNTIRGRIERFSGTMNASTIEFIRCEGTRVSKVPDHDIYQGRFDAMVNYYDT